MASSEELKGDQVARGGSDWHPGPGPVPSSVSPRRVFTGGPARPGSLYCCSWRASREPASPYEQEVTVAEGFRTPAVKNQGKVGLNCTSEVEEEDF